MFRTEGNQEPKLGTFGVVGWQTRVDQNANE